MLLVLLPFVAGVVLCNSVVIPLVWLIVALFVATVGAWLLLPRRVAWCYVAFALLLLGYITAELRRPVASLPYDTDMELIVEVVGEPAQRSGYRVAGGRVEAWREDASWRGADDAGQPQRPCFPFDFCLFVGANRHIYKRIFPHSLSVRFVLSSCHYFTSN